MNIKSNNIKRLEVEASTCSLSLTTSIDEDFHMVTGNDGEFTLEEHDGVIKIKQKKRTVFRWLFSWTPIELKVTVPASFRGETLLFNQNGHSSVYSVALGRLSVKNSNGTVECEDFTATELKLHNGNGRIEVQGASVKSVDASSGNGRIRLQDIKCEGTVKAKTGNGRLIIKSCTADEFDLKSSNGAVLVTDIEGAMSVSTGNGKIIAQMRGNEADYALDFATSYGAIYIGGERYQGRYVVKGEGRKLEGYASAGNVRIKFADTTDDDFGEELKEELEALARDAERDDTAVIKDEHETEAKAESAPEQEDMEEFIPIQIIGAVENE